MVAVVTTTSLQISKNSKIDINFAELYLLNEDEHDFTKVLNNL